MRNIKHYYDLVDRYVYHNEPEMQDDPQTALSASNCVFPVPDILSTAEYYHDKLGFTRVQNMDAQEKNILLKRGSVEIVLIESNGQKVIPNHELYGHGVDAYIIVKNPKAVQDEYEERGVKFIQKLHKSDYLKQEFVIEDPDGRWISFGSKE